MPGLLSIDGSGTLGEGIGRFYGIIYISGSCTDVRAVITDIYFN